MTHIKGTWFACGVLALAWMTPAGAYDAETHALITYKAYQSSVLLPTEASGTVARLGLDRLDPPSPFNTYWQATAGALGPVSYYDNTGATVHQRQPNEYERCQMEDLAKVAIIGSTTGYFDPADPMLSGAGIPKVAFLPVQNWLMRGVLREDDVWSILYKTIAKEDCGQPDTDPYGSISRVFNHFYDPIHDNGLSIGIKSIDWALGYVDSFDTPLVVDTNRRNHFTYVDARENMWRALTGESGLVALPYTGLAHAADAQERLYRWATTFRALGDVVHLLQDGASPQHVRNDIHSPIGTSQEQQAFEGFTNARVRGLPISKTNAYVRGFFQGSQLGKTLPALPLDKSYPVVSFATPIRFYTTRLKGQDANVLPDGRFGLMDYANRGFFTGGTLPGMSGNTFQRPPTPVDGAHNYTQSQVPCVLSSALGNSWRHDLKCTHYMHDVSDSVASPTSYVDVLPVVDGPTQFTNPPLAAVSVFTLANCPPAQCRYTVGIEELETMANLAVPRAIGYTAGLINYFFRGQLTVSTPADKTIGVLNQGAQHTMNAQGYPCVGTATTDGCAIFGFQYIRLNVLNSTPQITESGTAAVIPQNLSATAVGDVNDTNFHGPYLVAVAKYHRNTCYKPDLSGQRVQSYAPIPQQNIVDPICGPGQVVRTAYQEVSVSKSIAATAAALNGTSATEFKFDFTADPIPVNATDLFIQVVYRGPMGDVALGQEPDAIAVGNMDVREPTFIAFWDNTDYFWNGSWIGQYSTYPHESVRDFWVCGSGAPPKLIFEYIGAVGSPAMLDPFDGSGSPGQVRLGIIYPPPVGASQFVARGTPVAYPTGMETPIPVRSTFNAGGFQQANKENVLAATLTTPSPNCGSGLPPLSEYWCNDPVQKRRGQIFGRIAQPLYLFITDDAGDVDAPPPLSVFSGIHVLSTGTNRFNTDTTLITCPGQPAPIASRAEDIENMRKNMRLIELLEEARDLGVSGEKEQ